MRIQKAADITDHFGGNEKTLMTLEQALAEFPDDKETHNKVIMLPVRPNHDPKRSKA